MRQRVLVILIPIAVLVASCASSAPVPTWTHAPSAGVLATAVPSIASGTMPTVEAYAEPAGRVLTGDVPVVMTDAMRFVPDAITVKAGEPITFVVTNDGLIVHEFFGGTQDDQDVHAVEMAAGGMSHGHDNAVSVKPGGTASLTMTFVKVGSLLVGCHEPGHYAAGMKATLTISD